MRGNAANGVSICAVCTRKPANTERIEALRALSVRMSRGFRIQDVVAELGLTEDAANVCVSRYVKNGVLRRIGHGLYEAVKP